MKKVCVYVMVGMLCVAGGAFAQTLDTNVLTNPGFEVTGPSEPTHLYDAALGAGWWTGDSPFGEGNAGGDAWWYNTGSEFAYGGEYYFWWPAIGWQDVNSGQWIGPAGVHWNVDPADYVVLGANAAVISGWLNIDSLTAQGDGTTNITVAAVAFDHIEGNHYGAAHGQHGAAATQVFTGGGTAGYQEFSLQVSLPAGATVVALYLEATGGVADGVGVGIGGTLLMDDISILFTVEGPVCDGPGAGDGTETGDNFTGYSAIKASTAPTLDGIIGVDEYPSEPMIINASSIAAAGSYATGDESLDCDISAEAYLTWDDTNLYFAANVYDEDVLATDVIQFCLDPHNLGVNATGATDAQKRFLWNLYAGASDVTEQYSGGAWTPDASVLPGLTLASQVAAPGYVIEFAVPWASLPDAAKMATPTVSAEMGFLLVIGDRDTDGDNADILTGNGGGGGWATLGNTAEHFGKMDLTAEYTLTYSASTGGTLAGDLTQTVVHGGNGTAVTASADSGYYFDQWDDGSTTNPRTDTNVTSNITVTALFVEGTSPDNLPVAGLLGAGLAVVAIAAFGIRRMR